MSIIDKEPFDQSGAAAFARANAEARFYEVFDRVAAKAVEEMKREGNSTAQATFTDDERRQLREAYIEWQAMEALFKRSSSQFEFFLKHKRARTLADEAALRVHEAKGNLWALIWKTLFVVVTFSAALVVLFR